MNTDKLLKAIQILIKEELKVVLPKIVKEMVKVESKKLIDENKKLRGILDKTYMKSDTTTNTFMDEQSINKTNRTFSKNPILNEVLNNTEPFKDNKNDYDKTLNFNSNIAPGGIDALRLQMGTKLGYGDIDTNFNQKTGLGVNTGNDSLDKAFNRDYTELVRKFKK